MRMRKKNLISLLAIIFLIVYKLFIPSQTDDQKTKPTSEKIKVKRVIDGDTIELENNQIVRYIGIDTPELHDPRKPVECFAQKAYQFNKKLVEGKTVRLEKDVSETDKYKRLLRYVWLDNSNQISNNENLATQSSKIFVNELLVKEGYAYAATFPPDVKYSGLFQQAQEEATENDTGLWKNCKN